MACFMQSPYRMDAQHAAVKLDDDAPVPRWKSLRAKGWFAVAALATYLLVSVAYVANERALIDRTVDELQTLARHEKALALAESAVAGARVDVNMASDAANAVPGVPEEIRLYMESCAKLFAALDEFDPGYALVQRAIARGYDELRAAPVRAGWLELRETLARASDELEIRRSRLIDHRDALSAAYRGAYDAVTVRTLALSAVGIALFGGVVAWFFARLGGDIRRLEAHARDIVRGRRGVDLPVRREDELGRLMHAVNRMAADLDEREQQIALDGERRAHQEKMLAVGALAAGVAHEVNNPLAAVIGAAQALQADGPPQVAEVGALILAQAQRAAQAARRLAELAAPQPAEFDWLDLNALVQRVVQLQRYDKRYRNLAIETALDPQLPALHAPGATLQQVLMQLAALACDTLAAAAGAPPPVLRIASGLDETGRDVVLSFSAPVPLDLSQPTAQRTFGFARAALEPLGGWVAFDQEPGAALLIQLRWPADPGGA
jgi:two-component system, NtrC family, sensor kinase